jgi:hypothetical protein
MVKFDLSTDSDRYCLTNEHQVWMIEALLYHAKGDLHLANGDNKNAAREYKLYFEAISKLPPDIAKLIDNTDLTNFDYTTFLN